jgi:hypothetical protein
VHTARDLLTHNQTHLSCVASGAPMKNRCYVATVHSFIESTFDQGSSNTAGVGA